MMRIYVGCLAFGMLRGKRAIGEAGAVRLTATRVALAPSSIFGGGSKASSYLAGFRPPRTATVVTVISHQVSQLHGAKPSMPSIDSLLERQLGFGQFQLWWQQFVHEQLVAEPSTCQQQDCLLLVMEIAYSLRQELALVQLSPPYPSQASPKAATAISQSELDPDSRLLQYAMALETLLVACKQLADEVQAIPVFADAQQPASIEQIYQACRLLWDCSVATRERLWSDRTSLGDGSLYVEWLLWILRTTSPIVRDQRHPGLVQLRREIQFWLEKELAIRQQISGV